MAFVVSLNVLVFLMDDESFVQAQTSSDCLPSLQDALEVDWGGAVALDKLFIERKSCNLFSASFSISDCADCPTFFEFFPFPFP